MAESPSAPEARSTLADTILDLGKKSFDPDEEGASREAAYKDFQELIASRSSWRLLPALNALIKPGIAPAWLHPELMKILTSIPLRPDGVRGTLEFVFSVHPSSRLKASETSAPQKSGANITQEALAVATRIITSPPSSVSPEVWFEGISAQLMGLLDGNEGQELATVAAQVIMLGILGKRQFGAPGSPGWQALIEPLLCCINPSRNTSRVSQPGHTDEADIIDLRSSKVIVSSEALQLSLRRLTKLIGSTPYPAQTRRILAPILTQIWAISSWSPSGDYCQENFCKPARQLLTIYLKIASSQSKLLLIIHDLLFRGDEYTEALQWCFSTTAGDRLEIISPLTTEDNQLFEIDWGVVQDKSKTFVDILASNCPTDEISSLFMDLLGRWLRSVNESATARSGITINSMDKTDLASNAKDLLEVAVLQKMLESIPERLIGRVEQVLELVCQILDPENLEIQPDDILAVALSLLNLVITSPAFRKSNLKPRGLEVLQKSLELLGGQNRGDISPTARNLSMLLQYRDAADEQEENSFVPEARQVEDRNTYKLAISYITQPDNPPPVRSEGLNLLLELIRTGSSALDIQAALVLLSSLLQDDEDFINLRVIKVFTELANKHPRTTVRELLDRYLDAKEFSNTSTRLRFGEALLQVIERMGETFTGDVAKQTVETLLSIAGRRGQRPRTAAKQAQEARKSETRRQQAEDAWGGDVPDLGDDVTQEEQDKVDVITQIVEGWESKRGSEDVRVRASSLSILGTGIEVNISGIGPLLVSTAVDLCINILAMEPEPEKGILRRAAVFLVLGFVRALDKARQEGRAIGFGLTDQSREDILRVLKYIAVVDNDGLVQQHAKDVIESLEAWQMISLLPCVEEPLINASAGGGLLAGLTPSLASQSGPSPTQARPRIEEVE